MAISLRVMGSYKNSITYRVGGLGAKSTVKSIQLVSGSIVQTFTGGDYYSEGGGTYRVDFAVTGLSPNTSYTFIAVVNMESGSIYMSNSSTGTTESGYVDPDPDPGGGDAPPDWYTRPSISASSNGTTVTITVSNGVRSSDVQYAVGVSKMINGTWQDSVDYGKVRLDSNYRITLTSGFSVGQSYLIYVRMWSRYWGEAVSSNSNSVQVNITSGGTSPDPGGGDPDAPEFELTASGLNIIVTFTMPYWASSVGIYVSTSPDALGGANTRVSDARSSPYTITVLRDGTALQAGVKYYVGVDAYASSSEVSGLSPIKSITLGTAVGTWDWQYTIQAGGEFKSYSADGGTAYLMDASHWNSFTKMIGDKRVAKGGSRGTYTSATVYTDEAGIRACINEAITGINGMYPISNQQALIAKGDLVAASIFTTMRTRLNGA